MGLKVGDVIQGTKCGAEGWRRNLERTTSSVLEGYDANGKNEVVGLKVGDVMERTKWWFLKVGDVMERTQCGSLKVGDVMERTKCGAEGWRRNGKNEVFF